jgi:hypothetical protein
LALEAQWRADIVSLGGPAKDLGDRVGMPYQTLINMYLRDCAENRKELRLQWRPSSHVV